MKTALILLLVIVLAGGVYFSFANKTQAPVQNPSIPTGGTSAPLETTNPNASDTTSTSARTVTITYDGTTFSPSTVTIAKGETVRFVNTASSPMWVASDPHPTHQGYSGTSASQHCPDTTGTAFDECAAGSSYSFTFAKVGSWGYHNHANHNARGTIVVTN